MNPEWIGVIIVGLFAATVSYVAYRLSTKQLHAQAVATAKAVDAEAYSRAERIYQSAIGQLDEEVTRLRRDREALREERDQMRRELTAIEGERDRLHAINNKLESEVGRLRGFRDEAARLSEANTRLEAEIATLRSNTPGA